MKPLQAHIFALVTLSQLSSSSHEELCGKALVVQVSNDTRLHFPWAGALYSILGEVTSRDIKYICGASLLSMSFSVTAAHCIHGKGSDAKRRWPDDLAVYFGIYDLRQKNATGFETISEVFLHEAWNALGESYDSDIALLKLRNALAFSSTVSPICLWPPSDDVESERGTVISWTDPEEGDPGYWNHQHDPLHNFPQTYKMPIRSNTECFIMQPRVKAIASNKTFCAGGLNSGPCLEVGNSGASMAIRVGESFFLRGIVSASFIDIAGCDNVTFTLFTDVRRHKRWITEVVKQN